MERRNLGDTGIEVSHLCLGTMTWGEQNTEAEGHAQMDRALDAGIDFFDTAEMYPVPNRAETWFAARGTRNRVVLATKVSGPGGTAVPRPGESGLDPASIRAAAEASLKRLRTDVIDLYQVHWPARRTNYFGRLGYIHDPADDPVPIAETLGAMGELVAEGKVRAIGVSNETPWGLMTWLRAAAEAGLPRVAAIQNPYSLLNRSFEVGLAEIAIRERAGLLAYSPLAFGTLTGKYLGGARPGGARLSLFRGFQRYLSDQAQAATAAYVALAQEAGLDPAVMALAYVNSRPFVTATILGATSVTQLDQDISSAGVRLAADVLERIEAIHRTYTYPSP